MKSRIGWTLIWGVLFAAGLIAPGRRATAGNCALYARAETGVALFGAAGGWWDEAAGRYQRGHVPEVGSILVFKRTGLIPFGHVAVVSKIVGPGQVLVDQSNWYHGRVTRDTPVIDTSPDHDWSQVAVMNIASGEFGRDSPTYGFVYPETGEPGAVPIRSSVGFDANSVVSQVAYEPTPRSALLHFAVAEDGWHGRLRFHRPAGVGIPRRYSQRRERRRSVAANEHRSEHRSAVHASRIRASHRATASPRPGAHATNLSHSWRGAIHAAAATAGRVDRRPA